MSVDTSPDSPLFGLGYAIAAYVVIVTVLFGYIALLHWSQRRLQRRIDALEDRLGSRR